MGEVTVSLPEDLAKEVEDYAKRKYLEQWQVIAQALGHFFSEERIEEELRVMDIRQIQADIDDLKEVVNEILKALSKAGLIGKASQ